MKLPVLRSILVIVSAGLFATPAAQAAVGVGAKPLSGAEVLFDGTAEMLAAKWTYWDGPRLGAKPPIKWPLRPDPVDGGTVLSTDDPAVPKTGPR